MILSAPEGSFFSSLVSRRSPQVCAAYHQGTSLRANLQNWRSLGVHDARCRQDQKRAAHHSIGSAVPRDACARNQRKGGDSASRWLSDEKATHKRQRFYFLPNIPYFNYISHCRVSRFSPCDSLVCPLSHRTQEEKLSPLH